MSATVYNNLPLFLAYSVTLEWEAADRLKELAAAMEVHNNPEVKTLLLELAHFSQQHGDEVKQLCQGKTLPRLKPWEYSWPQAEPPEVMAYDQFHYQMTLKQCLVLALGVEQQAERFYQAVADSAQDDEVRHHAWQFASEERSHVAAVQKRLDALSNEADMSEHGAVDFDPPHMPE